MQCARTFWVGVVLLTVACGGGEDGGNAITGPSSQIPSVAGSYSGSTSMTLPELSQTLTCPTTTSVTQSGSTVTIAELRLSGPCGEMSIPMGQVAIDSSGTIVSETGSYSDPSCGVYNYSATGGFSGRELRFSIAGTSTTCWNFTMTMTLVR
jgi:hypothetical protein